MSLKEITKIIEAVLFVSGDGVDRDVFKTTYDLSDKELNKCLDSLKEKYNEDSGVNIITFKNKIQLCSNPKFAENIAEILNPIREKSLTKSALETVAIIAYKQPITRVEVENIRGVNCDYPIQLLQSNNLIEVVGRKDTVGKPLLFGTTDEFLKRFELQDLESLPNYKELLDRIRVIHSEGDSLYREFDIPDEENEEINDENAEENTQEIISESAEETNEKTNPVDKNEERQLSIQENREEIKIITPIERPKTIGELNHEIKKAPKTIGELSSKENVRTSEEFMDISVGDNIISRTKTIGEIDNLKEHKTIGEINSKERPKTIGELLSEELK